MKYDKPLLAILIGIIIVIPLEVLTQIFKSFNLTPFSIFELTSMMFIKPGNWFLGILSTTSLGALATVFLYYLTKRIGVDYLPIKGAIVGMITWALVIVIFSTLGKNPNMSQPVASHFFHAFGAALAGALAGFLMKRYLLVKVHKTFTEQ